MGRWRASNLPEEEPIERDGEKDADGPEGEELLQEFVVGLLSFERAEGGDDKAIGVEAVPEEGFLDGVFERDGTDEGAAGEGFGADPLAVGDEVGLEQSPERGDDNAGGNADPDLDFAGQG